MVREMIQKTLDYVDNNIKEDITAEELAEVAGYSLLQIVPISCWNTGYAVRFKEKALVCYL